MLGLGLNIDLEGLECPECFSDTFEYDSELDRLICIECGTVIYLAGKSFVCPFCLSNQPIGNSEHIQLVWCNNCKTDFYVLKV